MANYKLTPFQVALEKAMGERLIGEVEILDNSFVVPQGQQTVHHQSPKRAYQSALAAGAEPYEAPLPTWMRKMNWTWANLDQWFFKIGETVYSISPDWTTQHSVIRPWNTTKITWTL